MNILEYIDYLIFELGWDEEAANDEACSAFNLNIFPED